MYSVVAGAAGLEVVDLRYPAAVCGERSAVHADSAVYDLRSF
jgi:hypothetical protein